MAIDPNLPSAENALILSEFLSRAGLQSAQTRMANRQAQGLRASTMDALAKLEDWKKGAEQREAERTFKTEQARSDTRQIPSTEKANIATNKSTQVTSENDAATEVFARYSDLDPKDPEYSNTYTQMTEELKNVSPDIAGVLSTLGPEEGYKFSQQMLEGLAKNRKTRSAMAVQGQELDVNQDMQQRQIAADKMALQDRLTTQVSIADADRISKELMFYRGLKQEMDIANARINLEYDKALATERPEALAPTELGLDNPKQYAENVRLSLPQILKSLDIGLDDDPGAELDQLAGTIASQSRDAYITAYNAYAVERTTDVPPMAPGIYQEHIIKSMLKQGHLKSGEDTYVPPETKSVVDAKNTEASLAADKKKAAEEARIRAERLEERAKESSADMLKGVWMQMRRNPMIPGADTDARYPDDIKYFRERMREEIDAATGPIKEAWINDPERRGNANFLTKDLKPVKAELLRHWTDFRSQYRLMQNKPRFKKLSPEDKYKTINAQLMMRDNDQREAE